MRTGNFRARSSSIYVLIHYSPSSSSSSSSSPSSSCFLPLLVLLILLILLHVCFLFFILFSLIVGVPFILIFLSSSSCSCFLSLLLVLFLGCVFLIIIQFVSSLLDFLPHQLCPLLTYLLFLVLYPFSFPPSTIYSSNMPPPQKRHQNTIFFYWKKPGRAS